MRRKPELEQPKLEVDDNPGDTIVLQAMGHGIGMLIHVKDMMRWNMQCSVSEGP